MDENCGILFWGYHKHFLTSGWSESLVFVKLRFARVFGFGVCMSMPENYANLFIFVFGFLLNQR